MDEHDEDFLRWLVWHVEHDQWDKDRVIAFRKLLMDARAGTWIGQEKRWLAYRAAIETIDSIVSWQE